MVGDTAPSRDDAGSGIEPEVAPRVRRALGLLERFAPAVGSRWAIELWCTPPAVEMSLRMPPGVGAGEPLEATWSGHRIAGESWGDGPPVYLVHGWGGCRAHLGVFVKPLVEAGHRVIAFDLPSHNESDPGALAPGRTTIVECAEAVRAIVRHTAPRTGSSHTPSARRPPRLRGCGACRSSGWYSWRRWAGSRCIWISSPSDTASVPVSARVCVGASTGDSACRCSTPISRRWRRVSTIHRRFGRPRPRRSRQPLRGERGASSGPGAARPWSPLAGSVVLRTTAFCGIAPRLRRRRFHRLCTQCRRTGGRATVLDTTLVIAFRSRRLRRMTGPAT